MVDENTATAEVGGLIGILFMSQRFIADLTIDIIRMKQAFDGDVAAGASPFFNRVGPTGRK